MSDSVSSAHSEASQFSADASSESIRNDATASAGTLLRQGRLAAGLHIAALAVSLKVPVHRLEALESDRFDLLPDAVFARALASSVCRALKMDAAPVLAQLPVPALPRLKVGSARTHDSYTTGSSARGLAAWRALPKPVIGSAAVLVLAAAVLVIWPMLPFPWGNDQEEAAVLAPVSTDPPVSSDSAGSPAVSGQPLPAGDVATTVVVNPASTVNPPVLVPNLPPPPAPVTPNLAAPTVLPMSPGATPSPAAQSSTSGIIVFNPSAASWVEVKDAQGTVVLRRMLAAGEVVSASGALPLNAVVGRADVTKVQVRGQAFDLSSIARENVARFEVK